MRIVFMGTPEIAVPTLTALLASGHDVCAVYTQPPRPAGRGRAERKSPVHRAAESLGIPVLSPESFKAESDRQAFADHEPDLAVVVAYGLLLPQGVLDAPRFGCLNLHGSKLPRWRGAAPIQRAVMAGDTHTAVEVMRMDAGLDTGPVALSEQINISGNMTAGQLHDEMKVRGADLMVRAIAALERGSLTFTPQAETGVTYAKKIDKSEARIDFSRDAATVHNQIRGLSPSPGAWFEVQLNDRPVRVKVLQSELSRSQGTPGRILNEALEVGCGSGSVKLVTVQREGKAAMSAADFLRGTGSLLGANLT